MFYWIANLNKNLSKQVLVKIQILEVNLLALGGEAAVYKIEHAGIEEIVAKCPVFKEDAT